MSDTVQELRDRCDISKWHDAGLLNTYRPDTPFVWTRLNMLMLRAADELESMRTKIAELTQQRDAAEAELESCREKLAEIDTGGINLEH